VTGRGFTDGLLTDLYELTMAAGYVAAGISEQTASFQLSLRRLPPERGYVVAAGLEQAVEYLASVTFSGDDILYLRSLAQFRRAPESFFERLRRFRFTGDVAAVPEGTPVFPGEPLLRVRAPLIEAQIAETYLLATVGFQSMIATKAARVAEAAAGRGVVEFGTRRAHSPAAGVLAARAAYLAGCTGTSNALAGARFGIPVFGTAAHSWVLAFPEEETAFRRLQELLGEATAYIVDTYDTLEGVRRAAALGRPMWGIRLDSGDLAELARRSRAILDAAGLYDARIMATGDLNEYRVWDLVAAGAPIDVFGVGTELATSADAPTLGAVYKMVEMESEGRTRYTAKLSAEKTTYPGAKQVYRFQDRDLIALSEEPPPAAGARALLRPVVAAGGLLEPLPELAVSRAYARQALSELPPGCRRLESPDAYPVENTSALLALAAGRVFSGWSVGVTACGRARQTNPRRLA
jgi:nicotinate phosphoribosyltransferase